MTILHYELCGEDAAQVFSPHCWKTRMALEHKGLDYKTVAVPFVDVATVEGGSSDGGGRRVPVIRDGDTVVEDSMAIAEYLDKTYPDAPPLLGGPMGIAMTRFVVNWSHTQIHPAVVKLCMMDIYEALDEPSKVHFRTTREKVFGMTLEEFGAKFPKDGANLETALTPLTQTLKHQNFLGGEQPIFADYVVFGALQWLRIVRGTDVLDKASPVGAWFERCLDLHGGAGRSVPAAA